MDFKTAIRVHKVDIDMDTGEKLSHSEIYSRMIDKLGGVDAVWPCIPFTLEQIQKALRTDEHLNNLPMRKWDHAGGWITDVYAGREEVRPLPSRLRGMLLNAGVTCFSNAECVCLLKECARRKATA